MMELLQNITVTELEKPFTVHSYTGRTGIMQDRRCWGLSFSMGGQLTYTMDGKQYISRPGTAILLPQGSTYTSHCDRDGRFPVINFRCEGLSCREITLIPLAEQSQCLQLFEELKRLSLTGENRLEQFGCFYRLLGLLRHGATPKPLHFLNKHIQQQLSDPALSNTLLATAMGISEVYLRKLFVTYYQTTPKQYILELRLRKAKQLLMDSTLNVTQVAEACGFAGLHHFCRCFKEKTGMTPTQYANHHRIEQI